MGGKILTFLSERTEKLLLFEFSRVSHQLINTFPYQLELSLRTWVGEESHKIASKYFVLTRTFWWTGLWVTELGRHEIQRQVAWIQIVFCSAFIAWVADIFTVSAALTLDRKLRGAQKLLVVMLKSWRVEGSNIW